VKSDSEARVRRRTTASVTAVATKPRVREQNIAVFGASGSGKTVLLSSFYGAAQELALDKESLFRVLADDAGQGNRLYQNYLGMKNRARVPATNRFSAIRYSFTLTFKDSGDAKAAKSRPFDELRLVWHDYPGEWFEEEPGTDEELTRRVDTFRTLLRSDVALVLVDGQQLLDHAGEEERYLKALFSSLRDGLLRLKHELLDDGEPLVEFPRIWMLALSKSDLHPDLDVHGFRDLLVEKAGSDVAALHDVLREFVQLPEALSMGEDYLLLSSARFEPGRIEVADRIGLDLILPVAALLPLERLVRWAEKLEIPRKWLDRLADNADALATVLIGTGIVGTLLGKVPRVGALLAKVALPLLAGAIQLSESKIREVNEQARANRDYLTATLTQFQLDLDRGEDEGIFRKSPR
jgi:hypothetical protein